MPLIILGLIAVLGACLLIYYQLGPKVTLRLKNLGSGIFGPGGGGAMFGGDAQSTDAAGAEQAGEGGKGAASGEPEKVLYLFGSGEREERPLRDDDKKGE